MVVAKGEKHSRTWFDMMNKTKKDDDGGKQNVEGEDMQTREDDRAEQQDQETSRVAGEWATKMKEGREHNVMDDQDKMGDANIHQLDLNNPPTNYTIVPYANDQPVIPIL